MSKSKWDRTRVTGPLAPYAAGFASALVVEGYAAGSVRNQQLRVAQLSRWLETRRLGAADLTPSIIGQFLTSRRAAGYSSNLTLRGFSPLLGYLREVGAIPLIPAPVAGTPVERLMDRYATYLLRERGLRPDSAVDYVRAAKAFLVYQFEDGEFAPGDLSPGAVIDYVLSECAGGTATHARRTTSRLRSLLRFLFVDGVTDRLLSETVPSVANRRNESMPKAVSASDVARLLRSCDRRTATGRRDFAILTVLSRLGLRAGEVAGLRLGDLDWRIGEVVIRGKGHRVERLPLPVDVGEAIVGWLQLGRPQGDCRYLFTRLRAPLGGLSIAGVSTVVARACGRAGLPRVHAHRLRHAAATEMLRAGGNLAEIGHVLRHSRPVTTSIYAKADQCGLSTVIQPWPGGAA